MRLELRCSLALLLLLLLVAVAAPWLAPLDPNQQVDPAAARLLPPGSTRYLIDEGARTLAAEQLSPDQSEYLRLGSWRSVSDSAPQPRRFWLGTDRYGRDVASRVVYGARASLRVAVATTLVSLVLGLLVGGIAGWRGGLVDALLMRMADALFAFPQLFLVLAAAALWSTGELAIVVILGTTSWMETARITRSEILRIRGTDALDAVRGLGLSPPRILTHHLLPFVLPPVLIHTALRVGDIILIEASLSFLGFGIQPPNPSWGNLIAEATDVLDRAWWVAVFPGAALTLTVLAFGLLADGLADRLDPRRQG